VLNVASLATFAVEVGNHGLILGLDLLHFHMKHTGITSDSSERGKENKARYSKAAVDLVKIVNIIQYLSSFGEKGD
jgi:hypothetical protein